MPRAAGKNTGMVRGAPKRRAGRHFARARNLLRDGIIGKIHWVRPQASRNIMPGFGSPPGGAPPADFDYDMWLGPAPARPYSPHRGIYHFRWFWDFSGGQMTNLAAHSLDLMHSALEPKRPKSVTSLGGPVAR